jgi:hypothetical protein
VGELLIQPSRLAPARAFCVSRRIDWWQVIVDLERKGYRLEGIAAAVGSARTTVIGWKNLDAEPRHVDGERLCGLWVVVMGKRPEELPRQ